MWNATLARVTDLNKPLSYKKKTVFSNTNSAKTEAEEMRSVEDKTGITKASGV